MSLYTINVEARMSTPAIGAWNAYIAEAFNREENNFNSVFHALGLPLGNYFGNGLSASILQNIKNTCTSAKKKYGIVLAYQPAV